jgi:trehalose 6-phosphate synthase
MNLVAKEFIAARNDDQGVLVLSQFTGASRELPEALIVNPYDIDQCASALHTGPHDARAGAARADAQHAGLVEEFNVYRWAGRMLLDASNTRMRQKILRQSAA